MSKSYFVYIITDKAYGTLYIGVTSDLARRIWEHREGVLEGFSKKYGLGILVYYEAHATPEAAIVREKQIKKWNRRWKIELIERLNPTWSDLYELLNQ